MDEITVDDPRNVQKRTSPFILAVAIWTPTPQPDLLP